MVDASPCKPVEEHRGPMTPQGFEALLCQFAVALVVLIWASGGWLIVRSLAGGSIVGGLLRIVVVLFAVIGSFVSLGAFVDQCPARLFF
jgi:hypothetical protein